VDRLPTGPAPVENQLLQVSLDEAPRTLDAPPIGQHQREAGGRIRLLYGDLHQPRLLLPVRTPPVIERRHRHAVVDTKLAPRHPAFRESLNDSANLFLASRPAILSEVFRPLKMDSSDAYDGTSFPAV
jgi:hypothetical protein